MLDSTHVLPATVLGRMCAQLSWLYKVLLWALLFMRFSLQGRHLQNTVLNADICVTNNLYKGLLWDVLFYFNVIVILKHLLIFLLLWHSTWFFLSKGFFHWNINSPLLLCCTFMNGSVGQQNLFFSSLSPAVTVTKLPRDVKGNWEKFSSLMRLKTIFTAGAAPVNSFVLSQIENIESCSSQQQNWGIWEQIWWQISIPPNPSPLLIVCGSKSKI